MEILNNVETVKILGTFVNQLSAFYILKCPYVYKDKLCFKMMHFCVELKRDEHFVANLHCQPDDLKFLETFIWSCL